MKMELTPYVTCEDYPVPYRKVECKHGFGNQVHVKMMPECKNVTKQNCVTKWETDANGKQVNNHGAVKGFSNSIVCLIFS